MFRLATKRAFGPAGIYLPHVHTCRAIAILPKKRTNSRRKAIPVSIKKIKYPKAYSEVTMLQAEKRLGFRFENFEKHAISVNQMLADAKPEINGLGSEQIRHTKEKVFDNIIEVIEGERYPTEADDDFEAKVNDLVLLIILPILTAFIRQTGRRLYLTREKEIVATDSKTRGFLEFVGMDTIGPGERKFVFAVVSKPLSVGQAKRQCLLALKDMGDNNCGGIVYGFVTADEYWQMIRYDGKVFTQTNRFQVLFQNMENAKEEWVKESSIIVDCIHTALRSGGFVTT